MSTFDIGWSLDACVSVGLSAVMVIAVANALYWSWIRSRESGHKFDRGDYTTFLFLICLAAYFFHGGVIVGQRGKTTSPPEYLINKTVLAVATVVFSVTVWKDKALPVSKMNGRVSEGVTPRRRSTDWLPE